MFPSIFIRSSITSQLARRNFSSCKLLNQQFQADDSNSISDESAMPIRLPPCQMPNMMDIGSRSIFDEDHDIFRSSVRRFMREELAPEHKRYEAQVSTM